MKNLSICLIVLVGVLLVACDRSVGYDPNPDAGVDAGNNQNDVMVPDIGSLSYEVDHFVWTAPSQNAQIPITSLALTADGPEDALVTSVTFTLHGSIDPEEVVELGLYHENPLQLVATNYVWNGNKVSFNLSVDPIQIPRGATQLYSLRIRLDADPCEDTVGFDIDQDSDISAIGDVYGLELPVEEDPLSASSTPVQVAGKQLAFTFAPDNPGPADVSAGTDDHTFVAYNISATLDVNVQRSIVHVRLPDSQSANYFSDLKFWMRNANGDWVVAVGPLDLIPQMCQQDGLCAIGMEDSYILPGCQTSEFKVTMDVLSTAPAGLIASIDIPGDGFLMVSALDASMIIPPEDITGETITGSSQEVIF